MCFYTLIDIARLLSIWDELIYIHNQNALCFNLDGRMCYQTFQSLLIMQVKNADSSFNFFLFQNLDFFPTFKDIGIYFHFIITLFISSSLYSIHCVQCVIILFICVLVHHLSLLLLYKFLEGQYLAFLFIVDSQLQYSTFPSRHLVNIYCTNDFIM